MNQHHRQEWVVWNHPTIVDGELDSVSHHRVRPSIVPTPVDAKIVVQHGVFAEWLGETMSADLKMLNLFFSFSYIVTL